MIYPTQAWMVTPSNNIKWFQASPRSAAAAASPPAAAAAEADTPQQQFGQERPQWIPGRVWWKEWQQPEGARGQWKAGGKDDSANYARIGLL